MLIFGSILLLVPEMFVLGNVSTKMLGHAILAGTVMVGIGFLLYRFQLICDDAAHRMRTQKEQELAEKKIKIIYPTVKSIAVLLLRCLPRILMFAFMLVFLYFILALLWYIVHPILEYAAYTISMVLVLVLICGAFVSKSDVIDETT